MNTGGLLLQRIGLFHTQIIFLMVAATFCYNFKKHPHLPLKASSHSLPFQTMHFCYNLKTNNRTTVLHTVTSRQTEQVSVASRFSTYLLEETPTPHPPPTPPDQTYLLQFSSNNSLNYSECHVSSQSMLLIPTIPLLVSNQGNNLNKK